MKIMDEDEEYGWRMKMKIRGEEWGRRMQMKNIMKTKTKYDDKE